MPMPRAEIERMIREALPDAKSRDQGAGRRRRPLRGDRDQSLVRRHVPRQAASAVYAALKGRMGGELHALALTTSAG